MNTALSDAWILDSTLNRMCLNCWLFLYNVKIYLLQGGWLQRCVGVWWNFGHKRVCDCVTLQVHTQGSGKNQGWRKYSFVLDQYIGILLEKTFFCTKLIRRNDKIYFLQQINNEHFMLLIIVFNIRVGIFAQGTATSRSLAYNGWYTSARCDGKG